MLVQKLPVEGVEPIRTPVAQVVGDQVVVEGRADPGPERPEGRHDRRAAGDQEGQAEPPPLPGRRDQDRQRGEADRLLRQPRQGAAEPRQDRPAPVRPDRPGRQPTGGEGERRHIRLGVADLLEDRHGAEERAAAQRPHPDPPGPPAPDGERHRRAPRDRRDDPAKQRQRPPGDIARRARIERPEDQVDRRVVPGGELVRALRAIDLAEAAQEARVHQLALVEHRRFAAVYLERPAQDRQGRPAIVEPADRHQRRQRQHEPPDNLTQQGQPPPRLAGRLSLLHHDHREIRPFIFGAEFRHTPRKLSPAQRRARPRQFGRHRSVGAAGE